MSNTVSVKKFEEELDAQLSQMSMAKLVSAYNSYGSATDKPIKKFRDKKTAIERCKKRMHFAISEHSVSKMKKDVESVSHGIKVNVNGDLVQTSSPKPLRVAMRSSLNLDRSLEVFIDASIEGEEIEEDFRKEVVAIYPNVHYMWKTHPKWVTGAQVDRLTRVLYGAAKRGVKEVVEINGRYFTLLNVKTI